MHELARQWFRRRRGDHRQRLHLRLHGTLPAALATQGGSGGRQDSGRLEHVRGRIAMMILDRMFFFAFIRSYMICLGSTLGPFTSFWTCSRISTISAPRRATLLRFSRTWSISTPTGPFNTTTVCAKRLPCWPPFSRSPGCSANNELLPVLSAGVSTQRDEPMKWPSTWSGSSCREPAAK